MVTKIVSLINWLLTLTTKVLIWIHTITIYIYYVFNNYCTLFNIHILYIYYVSYPIILKINVSKYRIRVVSDTRRIRYTYHIRAS